MDRRSVAVAAAFGLLISTHGCGQGAPTAPPAAPAAGRPNFVVIVADDMAYGLFGPGRRLPFLQLPQLEALAARGVFFDRAFVTTSLCSPSRATLLSGLYAHMHGVVRNETMDLPATVATYPQLLQQAGYETAFVGKWHMNAQTDAPRPGFDYWLSFRGQGTYRDPQLNENGRAVQRQGNLTDLLTDYATAWLRRPHTRPFLLILSHKAPHNPAVPTTRHETAFGEVALPEPASFEDPFEGKPAWQRRYAVCGGVPAAFARCPDPQPARLDPVAWPSHDPSQLAYFRTLLDLDDSVGSVMAALQAQGIAGSTYVFFLSDNGLLLGEHRMGDKRVAYEESLRVPFVVAGADLTTRRVDATVLNLDLAPTILALAGQAVPGDMQGRSMAGLLHGAAVPPRESFLYEYVSEASLPVIPSILAVRMPNRKYVSYPDDPDEDELYDLASDPGELRNLARRPDWAVARESMRTELARLLQATGAAR